MNIDSRVITIALFLLAQAIGGVIYLSKLSSEVERIAAVQAASLPPLKAETQKCAVAIHDQGQQIDRIKELTAETSGLDVLAFKVEELRREIAGLREADRDQRKVMDEIMAQHESIFTALKNAGPMQQQSIKGYSYD